MSRFKTIASYRDLPIAELAKSKLESEGIPCTLLGKHHIAMNWLYSQAIGGVKVQVRAEDAEFAKKILGTDESASLANIDVGSPKDEKCCVCKRCGSANITLITQLSDLINYFILRCLSMPRPWVLVNEE